MWPTGLEFDTCAVGSYNVYLEVIVVVILRCINKVELNWLI